MIPVAVIELDEAHAALREAPRQQTVRRERPVARLRAVQVEDVRRLIAHVEQAWDARLHVERHLVLRDARLDLRIVQRSVRERVERVDCLNGVDLHLAADPARIRDVLHRIAHRVEPHALKPARQDAGRPLARRDRLHLPAVALRDEDDEAGQIVRLRTQSVEHPRSHARAARDDRAAVHEGVGRIVINLFGPHRPHDAGIVDDAADVGEQLAHHLTRLAELLEAVRRPETGEPLALQLRDLLAPGQRLRHRLAAHFGELGLVVEGLEVRGPAGLIQKDDAFGLRLDVERVDGAFRPPRRALHRGGQSCADERVQRDDPEARRTAAEKRPPVQFAHVLFVHGLSSW